MSGSTDYLQSHERVAVNECVTRLYQAVGDKLIGIWLFGSKVRGDFDADSDIDLLAVIQAQDWDVWHTIRRISARQSLEYDVLFNVHIIDRAYWNDEIKYQGTLWREIQRDGVPLLPEMADRTVS